MLDLDELDRVIAAATPGEWRVNKYGGIGAGEHGIDPTVLDELNPFYEMDKPPDNHTYIATFSPVLTKALVDEVRRLRAAAALAKKALDLRKQYEDLSGPFRASDHATLDPMTVAFAEKQARTALEARP